MAFADHFKSLADAQEKTKKMPRQTWILLGVLTLAAACLSAQNKDSFTPMPLDSGFGHMDVSAPATPPEEIIRRFAVQESAFRKALNNYTYRRTARIQEIDDDNKVTGEYYEVDDIIFDTTGRRTERVVYAPQNSLRQVSLSPSDLQDIQQGFPFVLTTEEIALYNVKYVGRQKVDEVDCYVFSVEPKSIDKHKRYFSGRVWVDATDLQIVVTNGRMVPDNTKKGQEDLHPPFMTWRQQVDGHYWFPVYTKGEGLLHFAGGYGMMAQDVHLRETIKYSDYKQFGSTIKIIYGDGESETPGQQQEPSAPPRK